jgi:hypothetical protein
VHSKSAISELGTTEVTEAQRGKQKIAERPYVKDTVRAVELLKRGYRSVQLDIEKFRAEYEKLARDGRHSSNGDVALPSPSGQVQTD